MCTLLRVDREEKATYFGNCWRTGVRTGRGESLLSISSLSFPGKKQLPVHAFRSWAARPAGCCGGCMTGSFPLQ